jgi:hypothetical protein
MSIYVCVFRREMIVGNLIMFESINYFLREDVFARFWGDKIALWWPGQDIVMKMNENLCIPSKIKGSKFKPLATGMRAS